MSKCRKSDALIIVGIGLLISSLLIETVATHHRYIHEIRLQETTANGIKIIRVTCEEEKIRLWIFLNSAVYQFSSLLRTGGEFSALIEHAIGSVRVIFECGGKTVG